MPIPRFRSGVFPEFCQFRMEKKKLALEMENLYDFPYSLMHIRPSDEISNHNKTNLAWHLHVEGNNKRIRTRYETCLKLKPKNKYTKITLSNSVVCQTVLCCLYYYL